MYTPCQFPEDGKKFDSSRDRNRPFEFKLGYGQVIQGGTPVAGGSSCVGVDSTSAHCGCLTLAAGWDEAVAQMSKNQIAKLTISADYAYGARGYPPMYAHA